MRAADRPALAWRTTRTPSASSARRRASVASSRGPSSTTTTSAGSWSSAEATASRTVAPSLKHGITTAVRAVVVPGAVTGGARRYRPRPLVPSRLVWRPWHGWLPAVLPASAQTFRTADADLAATLSESGAASAERADVELATAVGGIGGAAPCAIVFLREAAGEGAGL